MPYRLTKRKKSMRLDKGEGKKKGRGQAFCSFDLSCSILEKDNFINNVYLVLCYKIAFFLNFVSIYFKMLAVLLVSDQFINIRSQMARFKPTALKSLITVYLQSMP